jgi:hypothetical protein
MRFIAIIVLLSLAACSAPSAEQLQATAQQIAATGVAQTLEAIPTNTQPPTATNTPQPTATPQPTEVVLSTATSTAAVAVGSGTQVSQLPTEPSIAEADDRTDSRTPLLLQNNTDQIIWLIVDSPVYFEYRFSDSFLILVERGDYHYRAWVGNKGPFEGNFRIGSQDKHLMIFSNNKVQVIGP